MVGGTGGECHRGGNQLLLGDAAPRQTRLRSLSSVERFTEEDQCVGTVHSDAPLQAPQMAAAGGDLGGTMRLGAYEAELGGNSQLSVIDFATSPDDPVKPRKSLALMAAMVSTFKGADLKMKK